MPKLTDKVKVSVVQDGQEGSRLYTIFVRCDEKDFFLSDAFAARGIVAKLPELLAEAVRVATHGYIDAADSYLKVVEMKASNGNGHQAKAVKAEAA